MAIQNTNNQLISRSEISELMAKVKNDLSFGVKIRGSEINRNDVIRVWTTSEENIFTHCNHHLPECIEFYLFQRPYYHQLPDIMYIGSCGIFC